MSKVLYIIRISKRPLNNVGIKNVDDYWVNLKL